MQAQGKKREHGKRNRGMRRKGKGGFSEKEEGIGARHRREQGKRREEMVRGESWEGGGVRRRMEWSAEQVGQCVRELGEDGGARKGKWTRKM